MTDRLAKDLYVIIWIIKNIIVVTLFFNRGFKSQSFSAVDNNMYQSPLGPPPVSSCVLTITFSVGAAPLPSADPPTADSKTAC